MTVNRIFLHFNSVSKQESRYDRAVRWREQAQSVVEHIEDSDLDMVFAMLVEVLRDLTIEFADIVDKIEDARPQ